MVFAVISLRLSSISSTLSFSQSLQPYCLLQWPNLMHTWLSPILQNRCQCCPLFSSFPCIWLLWPHQISGHQPLSKPDIEHSFTSLLIQSAIIRNTLSQHHQYLSLTHDLIPVLLTTVPKTTCLLKNTDWHLWSLYHQLLLGHACKF